MKHRLQNKIIAPVNRRLSGYDGFYELGYIARTHGVQGRVIVKIDVDDPSRYKNLKKVYIEQTELTSYEVSSVSVSGKQLIFRLNGIDTVEDAQLFLKHRVFLPIESLPPLPDNKLYLHDAVGLTVIDEQRGNLGAIEKVFDLPEQPVAQVTIEGKEVLFPLITAFILRVDLKNKQLFVNLPEGLIEVYLS